MIKYHIWGHSLFGKVYIAGSWGFLVSDLLLKFSTKSKVITSASSELELRYLKLVSEFLSKLRPYIVINSAARVVEIYKNKINSFDFYSIISKFKIISWRLFVSLDQKI